MARGKTATITATSGEHRSVPIEVLGRGRSTGAAATRALLNLLKQAPFRRRNVVHVCIELSVVNTSRDRSAGAERALEHRRCENGG